LGDDQIASRSQFHQAAAVTLLGKPRRKATWDDLQSRFAAVVPGASFGAGTWVAWRDGPSIATVQARVGDTPGWEWRAVSPSTEAAMPPETDAPTLWMRRSISEGALARGLVRFYAAHNRYFTTDQDRYWQRFADICDEDEPPPVTYPIVEHITAELLATPDPGGELLGDPIDRLSARLRSLGYERLWASAYRNVG
jgi:hypothetical protein